MINIFWKSLVVSPAVLGASLLLSANAMAAPGQLTPEKQAAKTQVVAQVPGDETKLEQINRYSNEGKGNSQSQVTTVSQFSDVQPTDWAFQALQSLVERYGCIAGYPDSTYRGNRALTRYEFAAGLNACLDRVNELIATATADLVTKEDLATLQRLQDEFSAELATLRGRVDALEARTAELEANQFSTTTKLVGEAVFALTDAFGERVDDRNNTVFQNRVRLDFQSSFTGKDVLHTRIASGNATPFDLNVPGGTAEGTQTFALNGGSTNNSALIDWLAYYAPVGPANVYIAATGGIHSDYAATNNPYFEDYDGGNGALSAFASESPIYRIGGGAGGAINLNFGKGGGVFKPSSLTLGYLASEPNNPANGSGVFNGDYAALGQLNFNLGNRLALAATYVHGYHGGGSNLFNLGGRDAVVGTSLANRISATETASSNSYGASLAFKPSEKLSISGFVSYHDVTQTGANNDFDVWSYGLGVALPDFGKKGNVLGVFAGAQPYSADRNRVGNAGFDTPFQVEGFYKYQVNDNVSVTPGVIWLTAPGQQNNGEDAVIGTLRTTFTF